MELLQFVKEKLGEHKITGKEILVKKCPYCGKEKHKFSINYERGLFQCFSGSCREVGSIGKLYRKFGLIDKSEYNPKSVDIKEYCSNITTEIIDFFKTRGINENTIKQNFFDIMATVNNEISFIYRKKFEVHSIKVRSIKEKRFSGKKLKDLTLWKLDFCDNTKPLIICEGEIDQLSFEEQGIYNSVSVPTGAGSLSWLDTDYEELEKFKTIILALDNDEAGQKAVKEIMKRLPDETEVRLINFLDYKDANEVLMAGLELKDFIKNASIVEEEYYLKLSEIDQQQEQLKFSTGSKNINRMIGGIRGGELSIFTGRGGSGKSTILNQFSLEVAKQGGRVLIYSPELTDGQYKNWTTRQMIPKDHSDFLEKVYDPIEEENKFFVKKHYSDKMSLWLDKYFNYISSGIKLTDKEILKIIVKDIKKYNTKFIVIDNLMKINFENTNDIYESQKVFVNELSEISKRYNVCVNLVAHPKKHDPYNPDQYDIAGTSNMPNLVDNIYYFIQIGENDHEGFKKYNKKNHETIVNNQVNSGMVCLKSREGKACGKWEFMTFDPVRKRIHQYQEFKNYCDQWQEVQEDLEYEMFEKLCDEYAKPN